MKKNEQSQTRVGYGKLTKREGTNKIHVFYHSL